MGDHLGLPDDQSDFDAYNAVKLLIRSGGVNVLDTSINFRCQKAERTIGKAIRTLIEHEVISRD